MMEGLWSSRGSRNGIGLVDDEIEVGASGVGTEKNIWIGVQ